MTVYLRLLEEAELLRELHDYDTAKAVIQRGDEEIIPSEVVYALLDGANPVKVWREYRQMTQKQLAQAAEISAPYLSQIETGKRSGTTEALGALARALDVDLDDLVKP